MEEIQAGFSEGPLRTPFRQPGADSRVRGRSWALDDGVAGWQWGGVKMYKAAGRHAGVDTLPGGTS